MAFLFFFLENRMIIPIGMRFHTNLHVLVCTEFQLNQFPFSGRKKRKFEADVRRNENMFSREIGNEATKTKQKKFLISCFSFISSNLI